MKNITSVRRISTFSGMSDSAARLPESHWYSDSHIIGFYMHSFVILLKRTDTCWHWDNIFAEKSSFLSELCVSISRSICPSCEIVYSIQVHLKYATLKSKVRERETEFFEEIVYIYVLSSVYLNCWFKRIMWLIDHVIRH